MDDLLLVLELLFFFFLIYFIIYSIIKSEYTMRKTKLEETKLKELDDEFIFRKEKELENEFRLVKTSFGLDFSESYVIERKDAVEVDRWDLFKDLGSDIDIIEAKELFLDLTREYIKPVKEII